MKLDYKLEKLSKIKIEIIANQIIRSLGDSPEQMEHYSNIQIESYKGNKNY